MYLKYTIMYCDGSIREEIANFEGMFYRPDLESVIIVLTNFKSILLPMDYQDYNFFVREMSNALVKNKGNIRFIDGIVKEYFEEDKVNSCTTEGELEAIIKEVNKEIKKLKKINKRFKLERYSIKCTFD